VVARGVSAGILFGAWWCVEILMETSFLGFGRERPRSMSMWLVLSVETSICTNLKGEAQIAWAMI